MAERERLHIDGAQIEDFLELILNGKKLALNDEMEFLARLRAIKLVAMSFCGVLTPPYVYLDSKGKKSFRLSQRDLLGVELLKKNNFRVMVLSNRQSVVKHRCDKMGIECFTADCVEEAHGKYGVLKKILYGTDTFESQVLYIGDEINDLEVMGMANLAIATRDAHLKVRSAADYVTSARGGEHAVREVAELLLLANGHELKL